MKASFFFPFALTLLGTVAIISSCDKDKTQPPVPVVCPDPISFSATIEPMIQANCSTSGCHDAISAAQGYNLEGHVNISANAQAILDVINHEIGVTAMPYFQPKLSDTIIQQFDCWVFQGALDN